MIRDTFDFMDDGRRQRERFGENESVRGNDSVRSNLVDLSLILQQDRLLALMVSDPTKPGSKWVSLPKSLIKEYEIKSPGSVVVTIAESVARDKGLV
jgi:hypothetical protein